MNHLSSFMPRIRRTLAVLALSAVGVSAHADSDHDKARTALLAGRIQPLTEVLRVVSEKHPGRVIEVELEDENNQWIYEIKVLSPEGFLIKLEVNAVDLKIRQKRSAR